MDKESQLLKLAKKRQRSNWDGFFNLKDFHQGVYECDFVSPYTQSAKNLDADIFILLQDWVSGDFLEKEYNPDLRELGHDPSLPTNVNLKRLLYRYFGIDLSETYATNLFPFIKPAKMNAAISSKVLKKAAIEFALPQIQIIRPKLVIALGLVTFNALRQANNLKKCNKLELAISSHFKVGNTQIFCQAHTGALGQNNRNRGGVDRVKEDWAKMRDLYNKTF